MVDFAAHFTIHTISFQKYTFYLSLKVVHPPIACQSGHRYFHLDRISNSFSIHCSSSHTLLAAEKIFRYVA